MNTRQSASWTDATGRTWSAVVTVSTIARVKAATGVNLLEIVDGQLLAQFLSDPLLLVDVLYALCRPQAEQRGVSQDAFGDLFVGDVTIHAVEALVQGMLDFFPSDRRELLRRLWTATQRFQSEAVRLATTKLDSPLIEEAIQGAMRHASHQIDAQLRTLSDRSSSSPASSASIQGP